MPDPVNNDLGGSYVAQRASAAEVQAGEELLRRYSTPEPTEQGATQQPGAAAAPAIAPQQPSSAWGTAKNVASDVARGTLVESPRAIYTGAHDAVQNAYGALSEFGDWISKKTGYYGVHVGKDGVHMETEPGAQSDTDPVQAGLSATKIADPTSETGQIIKGVSQFLTGLALTRGLIPEAAGAGAAAKYGLSALHGAVANFAAFDPHQQRLSNLIERFPALSNPVTQFLAAKPDDSAAAGRFKNAIEGLGLGAVTDGFLKGVRLLRAVQDAKGAAAGAPAEEAAAAAPAQAGVDQMAFRGLGDETAGPDEPLLRAPTKDILSGNEPAAGGAVPQPPPEEGGISPTDLATAAAGGATKEPQTYINFARIDAPHDIERAMQELADARSGEIQGAQRGTQTFEQIKLNAAQQNAWNILKSRRVGDPLNAEQSVAARQLWGASAAKVTELAQVATQAPTEANLFAFRKMLSVHNAIQQEVIGARTETARALASWRIPTGTPADRLAGVTDMLREAGGGPEVTRELAQRVTQLAASKDPEAALALSKLVEKSGWATTRDGLVQAFSDGLLTSPVTQAKILASNVSTALWRPLERYVGSKISQLLDTKDGVQAGEAWAQFQGWLGGGKDGLAYAAKAFRTGVTGEGIGAPHEPFPSAISGEALQLGDHPTLGHIADFVGSALSMGRRGIAAQHDMALTMAYRGARNALAVRQAMGEINSGELTPEGYAERVADLNANPPDSLHLQAQQEAKYQAFLDEPGKIAQWLLEGRRDIPALRVIAPFIKIPARIMSYTFERTPLAPLMSDFRAKVAQGGATRDLALAQMALGSFITSAAADMTLSGNLKGGGPDQKGLEQAEEREGEMRDSIRIGNEWVNLNGVHPIGKLMLLAADVAENVTGGQSELHDPDDVGKILAGTTLAIGRTMVDNSYFQGISNLFAALHDANVKGEGMSALMSTAGSAVPAASGAVARALDPYQREVYSMLDEFKSKIPGLSKTLPPRRNLWGDPIPSGHGPVTNLISPLQMADAHHEPIDDEILKQGFNLQMPDRRETFGGPGNSVAIDMSRYPAAYSRLVQLSGNELKDPAWGLGLKDLLNQIVTGKHALSAVYNLKSDGPDGGKEVMIRDLMSRYRDQAKQQLLQEPEFSALAQEVNAKQRAQQALKLGVQ